MVTTVITKVVITISKKTRTETGKQVKSPSSRDAGFLEVFVFYHLRGNGSFLIHLDRFQFMVPLPLQKLENAVKRVCYVSSFHDIHAPTRLLDKAVITDKL